MNRTNFEHAAWALLMQGATWLIFGSLDIGAAFVIGAFLFREVAQREYHLGSPSTLRWYEGFDIWRWSRDAQLDFIFPATAVLIVSVGARYAGILG